MLIIVLDVGTTEPFNVTYEYFEWEGSSWLDDVILERAIRWYWFECVVIKDQYHVTMNRRSCAIFTHVSDAFKYYSPFLTLVYRILIEYAIKTPTVRPPTPYHENYST